MKRATAVLLVCAAAVLGGAPAALAYPTPPVQQAVASVTPSTIYPGQCTQLTGGGFAPGAVISVTDNGVPTDSAQADDTGSVSQQLCLPDDTTLGEHVIEISGAAPPAASPALRQASLRTGSAPRAGLAVPTVLARVVLTVTAAPVAEPVTGPISLPRTDDSPDQLAFTGFPVLAALSVGAGLLALGGMVTLAGRRRTA